MEEKNMKEMEVKELEKEEVEQVSGGAPGSIVRYICERCKMKFDTKQELKDHKWNVHR